MYSKMTLQNATADWGQ